MRDSPVARTPNMVSNTRNVTIDSLSWATAVENPAITEVIDLGTGDIVVSTKFISSQRYGELVNQRVLLRQCLKEGKPKHACALCWTPVYLVASMCKRFFFRHREEDGSCPAQTRNVLSQEEILARKYHGLRESEAHKRMKHLIERSLRADPLFEDVLCETRWKVEGDPRLWRQPDVQAKSGTRLFAFEAQLSTTFLDVVVSRRLFYRDEGAMLVWVLGSFSPEYRRMTTDDLLFSNNSNVFVVDDETVRISEERKVFHLRCHFRRPILDGDTLGERWYEELVSFHDLVTDQEGQQIFYFDYEAEDRRLREERDGSLRKEFIVFWLEAMCPLFDGTKESLARWTALISRFAALGVALPRHPGSDAGFRGLIHGVLSALKGEPVGWQFDTLVQVAHQVAESHPENLLAFGFAVRHAGHQSLLKMQDTTGKWQRRRTLSWARIKARDPEFMPDPQWLPALVLIFPEVGASVRSFLAGEPVSRG